MISKYWVSIAIVLFSIQNCNFVFASAISNVLKCYKRHDRKDVHSYDPYQNSIIGFLLVYAHVRANFLLY